MNTAFNYCEGASFHIPNGSCADDGFGNLIVVEWPIYWHNVQVWFSDFYVNEVY